MTDGTSICLVTMDKPDILRVTLDALDAYATHPAEFIIVDNGSAHPQTLRLLDERERQGWTVVYNEKNLGLSKATNQGLALGKFDCLIHLDDDCLVNMRGWNHIMRSYFQHEKVGLIVPSQTHEYIQHPHYREIRWGLGMCLAMRKSIFDSISGYDEQLIHQMECDLALRVRMLGFHVAGITDFIPKHNEPPGPRSELSKAREHLGCVSFRTKWCQFFRQRDWTYGTIPLYLMEAWPPDQEWLRRFALANKIDLNPPPPEYKAEDTLPGMRLGLSEESAAKIERRIQINGGWYMAYVDVRNTYAHFVRGDHYERDRQKAIDRWEELTGERRDPEYVWPVNFLRPQ